MSNRDRLLTQTAKTEKKVYRRPALSVYGDIRELTQTVGNTGGKDGGAGMTSKSQA
jgi:hypothetical protein